jgi:hypothetical protein
MPKAGAASKGMAMAPVPGDAALTQAIAVSLDKLLAHRLNH